MLLALLTGLFQAFLLVVCLAAGAAITFILMRLSEAVDDPKPGSFYDWKAEGDFDDEVSR